MPIADAPDEGKFSEARHSEAARRESRHIAVVEFAIDGDLETFEVKEPEIIRCDFPPPEVAVSLPKQGMSRPSSENSSHPKQAANSRDSTPKKLTQKQNPEVMSRPSSENSSHRTVTMASYIKPNSFEDSKDSSSQAFQQLQPS